MVATMVTQESKLQALVRVRSNLDQKDGDLFRRLFLRPSTEAQVCEDLKITQQELSERRTALLRRLMHAG